MLETRNGNGHGGSTARAALVKAGIITLLTLLTVSVLAFFVGMVIMLSAADPSGALDTSTNPVGRVGVGVFAFGIMGTMFSIPGISYLINGQGR